MAVNLVNRVQKIILSPNSEWDVIDKEPADVPGTLTGYVAPLVIVGVLASAIGLFIFGYGSAFGIVVRPSIMTIVVGAILRAVLAIVGVYVMAFIIDALAPSFGAQKNFNQAFKVAAYYPTPAWLGAILGIVPGIAFIGMLFGLYSLYLFFVGLPKLMKPPADKAVVYAIVCIVIAIVVFFGIFYIAGMVTNALTPAPTITGNFGGIQVSP